jgi:hypothetical protein
VVLIAGIDLRREGSSVAHEISEVLCDAVKPLRDSTRRQELGHRLATPFLEPSPDSFRGHTHRPSYAPTWVALEVGRWKARESGEPNGCGSRPVITNDFSRQLQRMPVESESNLLALPPTDCGGDRHIKFYELRDNPLNNRGGTDSVSPSPSVDRLTRPTSAAQAVRPTVNAPGAVCAEEGAQGGAAGHGWDKAAMLTEDYARLLECTGSTRPASSE